MASSRRRSAKLEQWLPPVAAKALALAAQPQESKAEAATMTMAGHGSNLRLKLCFNDNIRMFRISKPDNLQSLKAVIRKTFDELQNSDVLLKYEDAEGDTITVASDKDLGLALEDCSTSQNVPKFSIHMVALPPIGSPTQSKESGKTCKFYQGGYCKFGSRCKFSHSMERSSLIMSNKYIENWLEAQIQRSAAENIEQLSSPQGLQMIHNIAESRHLSDRAACLLGRLLVKEEIRCSMMRQDTNKIYGSLMGTRFVMQLQVHINSQYPLTAKNVEPFLLLIEELQLRTSVGWKSLPLDLMKVIIEGLPESPLKAELAGRVAALLEQRRKLHLLSAVSDPDTSLQGADYRNVPIIPSKEELLMTEQAGVPVNKVGMRYSSVIEYLETHFKLLREDFIQPLRTGIKAYQNGVGFSSEVRIYRDVRLLGMRFTANGIESRISFSPQTKKKKQQVDWQETKRLMFGSLLCISRDNFGTIIWATVAGRKNLADGLVEIQLLDGNELEASGKYVMVESAAAYFEAYSHVLKSLQREDTENIPFIEHLISLEHAVKEPAYLMCRAAQDMYDFKSAFPEMVRDLGQSTIHLLQEWPEWSGTLDPSQKMALKHALTKRLAIIQGPPGTGKTFIGLLLVKILLDNLKNAPSGDLKGPILIVCYTNHALDQFLEGIYEGEKRLIRIGGRCKSKVLEDCNLQKLIQKSRQSRDLLGPHVRGAGKAREQREKLEKDIGHCVELLNLNYVQEDLLHGVATEDQVEILFHSGPQSHEKNVVKVWLESETRERYQNVHTAAIEDRLIDQQENIYDLLDEDAENPDSVSELVEEENRDLDAEADELSDLEDDTAEADEPSDHEDDTAEADELVNGDFDEWENKPKNPSFRENDGWLQVNKRRKGRWAATPEEVDDQQLDNNDPPEGIPLHMFIDDPDVWSLTGEARRRLHKYWLDEIYANAQEELNKLIQEYQVACKQCKEADGEIQLSLLRGAKVIGMTTSAAARSHDILSSLKPEIVIVEEAAEVLESHILACISPYTKHLILIGDHLQLRPSVATYNLAVKHKLDVSMFERLVSSGVQHVMLEVQRRMKPCISKLISRIYPKLKDHQSVSEYEDVKGMKSSLFFLDHKAAEEGGKEAESKVNLTEARLIVELCSYLLNQDCYQPSDITILSMYKGQVQEIIRRLKDRLQFHPLVVRPVGSAEAESSDRILPRVSSVDDFQGEESNIILLSLVRSNLIPGKDGAGKIGFLNISNRVCVALSRARKGMYIFGNARLLSVRSSLWGSIIKNMYQDGLIGSKLTLRCQNHPNVETVINQVEDFKQVEDGGCSKPCEYQLNCGHVCPRRCHPGSHDGVVCPKICYKPLAGCLHRCKHICHGKEDCPPCPEPVVKLISRCGHKQSMACSEDPEKITCRSPCQKLLPCGHLCPRHCGRPCATSCYKEVHKDLPCGHKARMLCLQDPLEFCCKEPCGGILSECEHDCKGTCGQCKQGTQHIPCQRQCGRDLPCGHQCKYSCSVPCPPCPQPCQKRCLHSTCSRTCGKPCRPCLERCSWNCPHFQCNLLCFEVCQRPRCNEPCKAILRRCGHPCIGLCGEPCPEKCRICHPETLDVISQMTLEESEASDRFIELLDCRHIFEVSGLDQWMDMEEDSSGSGSSKAIILKFCPECKTPIRRTFRYANVVKKKLQRIEEVKKRVYGYDKTRLGIEMLNKGDYRRARAIFLEVIQIHPGLLEAHLGIARALCYIEEFGIAITHLRVIVQKSRFAAETHRISDPSLKKPYSPLPRNVEVSSLNANPGQALAIQALIQWASALTGLKMFTDAVQLCEFVLKCDEHNENASKIKEQAERGVFHQVVQAVSAEFQARGHWYQCPNGHVYVVGECGGPMQTSRCPDCQATIGGTSHTPAAGNVHSRVDGSTRPLYGDQIP